MSDDENGYECHKCNNIKKAVEFYKLRIRLYDGEVEGICNYCKISELERIDGEYGKAIDSLADRIEKLEKEGAKK